VILRVDTRALTLTADGAVTPCRIGRGGAVAAAAKREGDGATPMGSFPLRELWLRPDRGLDPPATGLAWRWTRPDDGWSDDPADPAYNRAVTHPHPFSAERMWRDDALYDIVVVIGWNDAPPVAGRGSAIFLHCAGEGATEGCVAIARDALAALLPHLGRDSRIEIR